MPEAAEYSVREHLRDDRPITIRNMGTLEDMNTEINQRMQTQPKNMFAWLPLMYWRAMLNGKGKLGSLMNERYPTVNPTNVSTYLKQNAAIS